MRTLEQDALEGIAQELLFLCKQSRTRKPAERLTKYFQDSLAGINDGYHSTIQDLIAEINKPLMRLYERL